MTQVRKLWPLLTATHRYEKTPSTRNRGAGTTIEAPIMAYLIESRPSLFFTAKTQRIHFYTPLRGARRKAGRTKGELGVIIHFEGQSAN